MKARFGSDSFFKQPEGRSLGTKAFVPYERDCYFAQGWPSVDIYPHLTPAHEDIVSVRSLSPPS